MDSFIIEFLSFLRDHKKLWLMPMLIIVALFGVQVPAVAPFIYALV